ncbi:MAG: hypothetical protein JJU19_06120 [Pararhodobacter sp.]|nr:hypothetical protein [Pararhodobacter sp.]
MSARNQKHCPPAPKRYDSLRTREGCNGLHGSYEVAAWIVYFRLSQIGNLQQEVAIFQYCSVRNTRRYAFEYRNGVSDFFARKLINLRERPAHGGTAFYSTPLQHEMVFIQSLDMVAPSADILDQNGASFWQPGCVMVLNVQVG